MSFSLSGKQYSSKVITLVNLEIESIFTFASDPFPYFFYLANFARLFFTFSTNKSS